ncbi:MAG: maleylacetoacetate isomerase [Pseudomonadota bacterium]
MKIRLHTAAQNSAGERVRIALNLKGLDFEYVPVASTRCSRYRRKNPQALIPTLEVDGIYIAQSLAAIEFLEEQFPNPALLPEDPILKARSRSFALAICAELHALTVRRVRKHLAADLKAETSDLDAWYSHWTRITLSALEECLANRPSVRQFSFADFPTYADIALVPQLANARRFNFDLSDFPNLREIEARCVVLPAFAKARPENQIDYER